MKISPAILFFCAYVFSLNSFAVEISDFAKKIACGVTLPGIQNENMELSYDSTMKVFELNFFVTQNDDGTTRLEPLKSGSDMSTAYNSLVEREFSQAWISPNVLAYAPSPVQNLYQNSKMKNAARYLFTAQARIYSYDGNPEDIVKLTLRDLLHVDEMRSEPNQQIELKVKDSLTMAASVPTVAADGKTGQAQIIVSCGISK